MSWNYILVLASEGSTWHVNFDEWMFIQPDKVLINRTNMSNFVRHIGQVIIVFGKEGKKEGRQGDVSNRNDAH